MASPEGSHIVFCPACGHRWLRITEEHHDNIADHTYTDDYAGYRPDAKFVATAAALTREEFEKRVPPPGRVLDVGCGAGEFMAVAKSAGYEVQGIDVSEAGARICRSKGLDAWAGDFLIHRFNREFDLITMWDVVEHLHEPAAFFRRGGSLLSTRGYIFAKIPGFGDLSVALSNWWPRVAGTLLGAPAHVQYFDRHSLSTLFEKIGFEAEWIQGGSARSKASGGSLKRRFGRRARNLIQKVSGDGNLYVLARPAR